MEKTLFDDYWRVPSLYGAGYYDQMPAVPSVHISGWYDPYAVTAVENFRGLQARGHPTALILGPWTHGMRSKTFAGDVDFGPQSTFDAGVGKDYVTWRIDFFKQALDRNAHGEPPVGLRHGGGTSQVLPSGRRDHGGAWITSTSWPPAEAKPCSLYLDTSNRLSFMPPAQKARYEYRADPSNPVPTIGGPITSGAPLMEGGAYDQRTDKRFFSDGPVGAATAERDDVVVFETGPLEEDVVLVGDVKLVLYASSDAENTDFTAKLVDVYPDGFAMNLCDGILRACYRNGFDKAEPLTPGKVEPFTITLYPTANRFAKGHKIRLEVSSSTLRFDICPANPGHHAPNRAETGTRYAQPAVHHCHWP